MKKILSYSCLGLNVLLLFVAFFENQVEIPNWFSFIGRVHPLVLHLPIGLTVALLLFNSLKPKVDEQSFDVILDFLLLILAFTSVLSAFAGLVLSFENGYEAETIKNHKYTGIGLSLLVYLIYEFRERIFASKVFTNITLILTIIVVSIVGHLGGNITHGEDFLLGEKETKAPETTFDKFVYPILDQKCKSCHNDQKTKGQLNMSTIEKIKKGGKNGQLWVGNDTLNSHILKRAYLDLEDKKHMPPKGKPQLTAQELLILKRWIQEGAKYDQKLSDLKPSSFFYTLASNQEVKVEAKVYSFSAASENTINELTTPFCTIKPIANNSPAIKVNFYVSSKFDPKTLSSLSKIGEQIVSLNLSKMPVTDESFGEISKFQNLEYLNLNQTNITGKGIEKLKNCKNLEVLAVANTKISFDNLQKIMDMPSLKEMYLWETKFTKEQYEQLKKSKKIIELGYVPDESETLKLNPPILVNENQILEGNTKITLKHTLQNVDIRYTLDGTNPDSTKSAIYKSPISIKNYGSIKTVATKNGWLASDIKEFYFFKSNLKAKSLKLLTKPNPQYPGNGESTLIDRKQGDAVNFKDKNWLGFRENPMEALFDFEKPSTLNGLTISYAENTGQFIMPPVFVDVYIKEIGKNLTHFKKVSVAQLTKMTLNGTKGIDIPVNKTNIEQIKIIVQPISKLPSWHPGKGDKGWFFVDEVFFY
ncbi:peptidylprolyl isomerase [Lacihabitans sp. CCS-44]|uniref:FN3 associated domain-containing protein n=1 Tax=Lacihabitans sp. CCS-44 TaxID=2487331 RepID=UPI0020CE65EB|nr:FN3 associated domain-containing protein [Lacihabitans sp. CCS-44]MCP9757579.1 peptidylprolyl isomerase [Lacihabitans sp. CCS-44]